MAFDPVSAGIMGGAMVFDAIGGSRAARKQKKLFRDFQRSLVKREEQQIGLERIARGELQVSLAEGSKMFDLTMKAISASNSVASRRLLEDINRREAEAQVRGRQRGLMGSSATSTEALGREREVFRAALDAETARSAQIGQVLQGKAQFEANARGQIANSFRAEGAIGADAGRELRRALEGTTVQHSPISGGVGQVLGQLGMLNPGGKPEAGLDPGAQAYGVSAGLRANPFIRAGGR